MTTWLTTGKSRPLRPLLAGLRSKLRLLCLCRSVVVSLRLLPKLFGTFQQFGSSYDTHWITMYARRRHGNALTQGLGADVCVCVSVPAGGRRRSWP